MNGLYVFLSAIPFLIGLNYLATTLRRRATVRLYNRILEMAGGRIEADHGEPACHTMIDDYDVRLVRSSNNRTTWYMGGVTLKRNQALAFSIKSGGFTTSTPAMGYGSEHLRTGIPAFDAEFSVSTTNDRALRILLTAELCRRCLDLRRAGPITVRSNKSGQPSAQLFHTTETALPPSIEACIENSASSEHQLLDLCRLAVAFAKETDLLPVSASNK